MAYPVPKYSRARVDRAGSFIMNWKRGTKKTKQELSEFLESFNALNNWRSAHSYPLNTFNSTLRDKVKRLKLKDCIIAQRLKRTPSIIKKLRRFKSMNLSRMQDIGGLRVVVTTNAQVQKLVKDYKDSQFDHVLSSEKDYITNPQESGYRSVHLVYKYKGKNNTDYDGLCIELQVRTKIQHSWATAVETMGIYLSQSLKSSEGSKEWLEFFSLVSSAFAYLEKTPCVPRYKHLSKEETFSLVKKEAERLRVIEKLSGYNVATEHIVDKSKSAFHLIVLFPERQVLQIRPFSRGEIEKANKEYTEIEKKIAKGENIDAVLVATGPIKDLKKAYPNYFLDTHQFIVGLKKIIKEA